MNEVVIFYLSSFRYTYLIYLQSISYGEYWSLFLWSYVAIWPRIPKAENDYLS